MRLLETSRFPDPLCELGTIIFGIACKVIDIVKAKMDGDLLSFWKIFEINMKIRNDLEKNLLQLCQV